MGAYGAVPVLSASLSARAFASSSALSARFNAAEERAVARCVLVQIDSDTVKARLDRDK